MTTLDDVRADIKPGVTVIYRRFLDKRRSAVKVTAVDPGTVTILTGNPVTLGTGRVRTWAERTVSLCSDDEVEIIAPTEEPDMATTPKVTRTRDREWTLQRRPGVAMPWLITHLPTRLTFAATSEAEARRGITSGGYGKQVADRLRPRPAGRRDWYYDSITGAHHLYTGGMFSWHCDLHGRVCDPFTPITADDILRMVARDTSVDDDVFVVLARAVDGRPITD